MPDQLRRLHTSIWKVQDCSSAELDTAYGHTDLVFQSAAPSAPDWQPPLSAPRKMCVPAFCPVNLA